MKTNVRLQNKLTFMLIPLNKAFVIQWHFNFAFFFGFQEDGNMYCLSRTFGCFPICDRGITKEWHLFSKILRSRKNKQFNKYSLYLYSYKKYILLKIFPLQITRAYIWYTGFTIVALQAKSSRLKVKVTLLCLTAIFGFFVIGNLDSLPVKVRKKKC